MTIKELKNIIENIDDEVEIYCWAPSYGEVDYNTFGVIKYNEDKKALEFSIEIIDS